MKLSERLRRTAKRQGALGRYEVENWYMRRSLEVIKSGKDREYPPLRDILKNYQQKKDFTNGN